jgi:hypothetical protein
MTKKMQGNKIRKIFSEAFKREIIMFCKFLIAMLFPVFTIFSYANFNACDLTHKDVSLTVNQIIEQQPDSICRFDGERMYLIPHRIFPTTNGLFLCNDQSSIFLPALLGDQNGVYLPCARKLKMRCINEKCRFCCWDAYQDGIECPVCTIPGDPA